MPQIPGELAEWQYPAGLPPLHAGFSLKMEQCWEGLLYRVFSYDSPGSRRRAAVVYDSATCEYMLRITVGLIEFCDVRYIHPKLATFESMLQGGLLAVLTALERCVPEQMESLFRQKKITEWPYDEVLPSTLAGFDRVVCPANCVQVTNGSYLIVDYSDYVCASSLRFFYNVFRDDFFAEYLDHGVPEATAAFDCKSLAEFDGLLKKELSPSLQRFRQRLDAKNGAF